MAENKNMELYDAFCTPPHGVLKTIEFGALKGKSDINPQWRYEVMTSKLGACGVGWKFTIDNHWTQEVPATGELMLFVMVTLYIKQGKEWSEGIPAYGGDYLIKKDKNGLHGNDEAMKMAITDALGTAMKYVGVAADVYRGLLNGVNAGASTKYEKRAETSQNEPQAMQPINLSKSTKRTSKTSQNANDEVRERAMNRLKVVAKDFPTDFMKATAKKVVGKESTKEMSADELIKVAEELERLQAEASGDNK